MSKISEQERIQLIVDLRKLYEQNLQFIADVKNGTTEKHYKKENIADFKKLNSQLKDYIADLEFGLEADKTLEDWCLILGDTLLDDDNFPYEEDGFSWHKH